MKTTRLLLVALALAVPACAPPRLITLTDAGPSITTDAAASDAPLARLDDAPGSPDAGSPDGGPSAEPDGGPPGSPDAGPSAEPDGGPPPVAATCGDGYIDSPETCDPAYEGGAHGSMACPRTGADACSWCPLGRLDDGGCVYGDYASDPRPAGWTYACRDSARNDLSWLVWHNAAERDAVIAAYRSIGTSDGTTNVSGWIGYGAGGWVDTGMPWTADALLPFHNTHTTGRDCVTLTVTDADAYLRWESCTSTTVGGLCVTRPWGEER